MKASIPKLKYQRVEVEIRQLAQTLPIGAKLPSERELAVSYGCNFLTVRKALKCLVEEGVIVRRVGSGTFICDNRKGEESTGSEQGRKSALRPDRVGILVHQECNDYAYRVLQAISHSGLEQNVDLRSVWLSDFGEDALNRAHQLQKSGCVALTLPWFPHELIEDVRLFVQQCPLPVSLAMLIPGLEKNCFVAPNIFGSTNEIEDLCMYYQSLGHRRIALIGPDSPHDTILQKKVTSHMRYTTREDLANLCGLVAPGSQAMDRIAERWKVFRGELAIISYDDEHALRFMTAMHKLGLSAPEDFCIIGYNDTEASAYSDPPLSTVHQYYDHIGNWLLKSALALSRGTVCQAVREPRLKLLIRSTCGGRGKINETIKSKFSHVDPVPDGDSIETAFETNDRIPTFSAAL